MEGGAKRAHAEFLQWASAGARAPGSGTAGVRVFERVRGIEPPYQPWKGCVIAIIRHPRRGPRT